MIVTVEEIIEQIQNYQIYKEGFSETYYEHILIKNWFNTIDREYILETYYNDDDIYEGQVITTAALNENTPSKLKELENSSQFVHDTYFSVLNNEVYIQTFLELHDIVNLFPLTTIEEVFEYLKNAPKILIKRIDNKNEVYENDEEELPF
jgi:hypothetical protein